LPISAVDAINPAFLHTKEQLLHPFRAGEWAKFAFVGFLAGELSTGDATAAASKHQAVPVAGSPCHCPTSIIFCCTLH
jgi:hypothetical protein